MKKIILVVVMIAAVATVFAYPPMMGQGYNYQNQATEVTELTGKVKFNFTGPASLDVNGKLYYLMIPRWSNSDVTVKDGDKITVKGYVFTDDDAKDAENYVHVTTLVIGGKEYEINNGPMGNGPMMGGKGNFGPKGKGPGKGWN